MDANTAPKTSPSKQDSPTAVAKRGAMLTAAQYLLDQLMTADWVRDLGTRYSRPLPATPDAATAQHLEATVENVANPAVKALIVAALLKQTRKPIIWVCAEPQAVLKYRVELSQLVPLDAIDAYPIEETSPYDQSVSPVSSLREHLRITERWHQQRSNSEHTPPSITLIAPKSLLLKHVSRQTMADGAIVLSPGSAMAPEDLLTQCLERGYIRASLVMGPGEVSARGDIVDVYPVSGEPVRIEFFGDTVETLRQIDVENQRSVQTLPQVVIAQRSPMILSAENRQLLSAKMEAALDKQLPTLSPMDQEALDATIRNHTQVLAQKGIPDGLDYYAPLVYPDTTTAYQTLMDQLPPDALVVFDDWQVFTNHLGSLSDRLVRQHQEGIEKGRLLNLDFAYHLTDAEALAALKAAAPRRLFLDNLPTASWNTLPVMPMLDADGMPIRSDDAAKKTSALQAQFANLYPLQVRGVDRFKADIPQAMAQLLEKRREGYRVFVTTEHPQRFLDAAKEYDLPVLYWPEDGLDADEASWLSGGGTPDIMVSRYGPQEGFWLPDERIIHYTDTELFGRNQKRVVFHQKRQEARDDIDVINSIHDLRTGDYVVHVKHGIGQFKELATITMDGEKREYLTILYAGNDKLHVPVDQVNLLSRYRGAGDKPAKLNKMGGTDWSRVKSKVQKSIADIARDLVQLYARRAKAKGVQFEPDSPWQMEMEEAFPYAETPDQWQAIQDMKADMESDRVMDRLICGDVGFGKTEVALRGIFKAVLSGRQVAVLVPTTILAQQHFNVLTERFKPYPVRVGLLSRFRSPKEQQEVVRKLGMGELDVVVGTHRLLQKDIKFHNLGLLVIDEEQRFGVSHKEKIKQLRAELDVLTLSATPIPRTLYMSLSGVREMSLIKTPPTNRLPIQTIVGPYNPAQIRMAILQEMDRGGQIFFLHNRVQTIYAMAEQLQDLVPEARFMVGHGQMDGDTLETVMLDFANRQADVLICTTIIESGLDIPNVNTIIVDRADRFGLAQLYQIRGRVGRSHVQAYAYCYYEPDQILTEDAKGRLRAIREFTTLGSGYQIALRDLEIRGVGNILGSEQHGHMVAVGFDLYTQMLEESIQELQGQGNDKKEPAIVDLNVTAFIPQDWVGDQEVKLTEYKRLAAITTPLQLEHIQLEWQDRFGEIPWEAMQLVKLVQLRILATDLRFPLIRGEDDMLRITVPFSLQEWMALQKRMPTALANKARWMPAAGSKQGSQPSLVVKHQYMSGEAQVELLMTLLTGIQEARNAIMQALSEKMAAPPEDNTPPSKPSSRQQYQVGRLR